MPEEPFLLTANPQFHELAKRALNESEFEKAEAIYLELISAIETLYGKSQKDVANELQRIAKTIETGGDVDASMEFKQRTCAVLLKISMAERHRNRVAPQAVPQMEVSTEPHSLWLKSEILLLATSDFDVQLTFYRDSARMSVLQSFGEKNKRLALIDVGLMYKILLLESRQLSGFLPLFVTERFEDCERQMRSLGFVSVPASLDLPGGTVVIFRDRGGNSYALARAECLRILRSS